MGTSFHSQKGGKASPQFSAHVYCGESWMNQDPTWYGGRPRLRPHCARQGPSSPAPKRGTASPIFVPCVLWPNGWMDQDATWYHGGRPRPRRNPLKFAGVPQTRQQISAVSRPKFAILWGHVEEVLLLNKFFFWLWIRALVAKIQPDKVVRWC